MKTVRGRLLKLMLNKGTISRKDLCLLIFKAQGKKVTKTTKYRPGYYGTNLQQWVMEGLLERPKAGGYRIGKLGEDYVKDPEKVLTALKLKRVKKENKSLLSYAESLRNELRDLESRFRDIKYILNK